MNDDGDAVIGQHSLLQAGGLLLILQRTGGQADVAGTLLHGGDAGAGAGGVVVDGDAAVLRHEGLAQGADDLLHGGGAVGGDGAGQLGGGLVLGLVGVVGLGLAAAGHQAQGQQGGQDQCNDLFHMYYLVSFVVLDNSLVRFLL